MRKPRWLLTLPVALAAILGAGTSYGAGVRDEAGLFSKDAVAKADAELSRIEQKLGLNTTSKM